jgi:circadian clock protein KaiB
MEAPRLTLYLAGEASRTSAAVESLRRAARERLGPSAELEVVDVLADPERARADGVLLVPTLILGDPGHGARAFGDLSGPVDGLLPALASDA